MVGKREEYVIANDIHFHYCLHSVKYCKEKLHVYRIPEESRARRAGHFVFSACAFCVGKDFSEREFRSQPLGHGVYELAYDRGQKALYAASAPSFDKDKTAGVVFRLAADSLRIDEKIATERRAFALSG